MTRCVLSLVSLLLVTCATEAPPKPHFQPLLVAEVGRGGFSWDRYHDRRDACTQLDRLRWACSDDRRQCDQVTERQLERDCTPWRK